MMYFFWPTPPQTFGELRPASLATSTNTTGEAAGGVETAGFGSCKFVAAAASRSRERFHFQSGLISASNNAPPRTTPEEPRKRRRREFMIARLSTPKGSSAPSLGWSNPLPADSLCAGCSSAWYPCRYFWKRTRNNPGAFLYGDDSVDGETR